MLKFILKRFVPSKALTSRGNFKSKSTGGKDDVETTTPGSGEQPKMVHCRYDLSSSEPQSLSFWSGFDEFEFKRQCRELAGRCSLDRPTRFVDACLRSFRCCRLVISSVDVNRISSHCVVKELGCRRSVTGRTLSSRLLLLPRMVSSLQALQISSSASSVVEFLAIGTLMKYRYLEINTRPTGIVVSCHTVRSFEVSTFIMLLVVMRTNSKAWKISDLKTSFV